MVKENNYTHAAAFIAAVMLMMTCGSVSAHAQRTMNRQNVVTLEAASSCYSFKDVGMHASWGQYGLTWYWKAWLNAGPYSITVKTGDRMTYGQVTSGADFMYRLVSNRRRSLSLYAGGGAFLGIESYNLWHKLPPYIETDFPKARFLYGLDASLEFEAYISRTVALTVSGTAPFTISSLVRPFHFQLRLGVRVAL